MRLGSRHDVLDVSFSGRVEALAGVRAVDTSQLAHDVVLDALRVAVVVSVVR